jgi:hypothetical protein
MEVLREVGGGREFDGSLFSFEVQSVEIGTSGVIVLGPVRKLQR